LGRTIGATPEEASKLIQAADDVQISYETLTTALEAAIRKGVEPTIEGLGGLADQYNAIQDPIERTKFLMDNFGRSGADLAPLMELALLE
jgi:antitoxin component HigA of HigAB toxin-antitoxin module